MPTLIFYFSVFRKKHIFVNQKSTGKLLVILAHYFKQLCHDEHTHRAHDTPDHSEYNEKTYRTKQALALHQVHKLLGYFLSNPALCFNSAGTQMWRGNYIGMLD